MSPTREDINPIFCKHIYMTFCPEKLRVFISRVDRVNDEKTTEGRLLKDRPFSDSAAVLALSLTDKRWSVYAVTTEKAGTFNEGRLCREESRSFSYTFNLLTFSHAPKMKGHSAGLIPYQWPSGEREK